MPKPVVEPKGSASRKLDRRAMMRTALAVGGVSALAAPAVAASQTATRPEAAVLAEREWARVLARHVANQLPEAVRQLPDLQLTDAQVQELRRVFQNTLVTNMGCEVPPG
jgi:Spy/CpxP family protein refolding chaperone